MSTLRLDTPRAFVPLLEPKRYKGAYGGRGSGKSHFFGEMVVERALDGARVVCIREVQNSLKDSVYQLIVDKIRSLGVQDQFDMIKDEVRGPHGSLITFRGMKDSNAENIKSLEGYDIAWVEEAQTFSSRSLELLRPTLRKPGSELWFSWNPRHKTDPVDEFFRKRKLDSTVSVRVNYNDNPWFAETPLYQDMLDDRAADPEKAAHIWDGAYESAPRGSYYGPELAQADSDGRITDLLIDTALPVHTGWDLGVGRNMCTWAFQIADGQYRWLKFFEYDVAGLPYAANTLKSWAAEKKLVWGTHLWPHDGASTDDSGEKRCDNMAKLGFKVDIVPRGKPGDGIEAVRRALKVSRWDRDGCGVGLEHLRGYRRKYDKHFDRFVDEPEKNGHDHGADAKRTAVMGRNLIRNEAPEWDRKIMNFSVDWVP